MLGKKSLVQIVTEAGAIDPDLVNRASIRKTGGMSKERIRRKAPGERTRVKAVGGGKFEPVVQKDRKDMGKERKAKKAGEFQATPEKERGSAALSAKEAQRKAYRERKAREAAGQKKTQSSASLEKKATQLIKKPSEPQKSTYKKKSILDRKTRDWKGEGVTGRKERDAARNKEKSQSFSQKKADAISSFTKTHGRAPNKKEKMQIAGRIRGLTK